VCVCGSDWDENLTEDQAKKAYDKMLKIEEEFGDLFTGSASVCARCDNCQNAFYEAALVSTDVSS